MSIPLPSAQCLMTISIILLTKRVQPLLCLRGQRFLDPAG